MLQLRQGMEVATGHRLQQFLGQGQFGEVWRALAPGGVGTALKFINLIDAAGLGQKEYAAIQRVKDVNHPNLMSPLGIWRLDREGRVLPDPPPLDIDSTTFFKRDAADRESDEQMTGPQPSMLVVAMQLASCAGLVPAIAGQIRQSRRVRTLATAAQAETAQILWRDCRRFGLFESTNSRFWRRESVATAL